MKPKPNQAPDDKPQVRRGRPPAGDRALTGAERQRAYRQRQHRAEIDSIGAESEASRVTLLGSLAHALTQLDADRPADQQAATRLSAGRIIQEIVTRYGIELAQLPKPQAAARKAPSTRNGKAPISEERGAVGTAGTPKRQRVGHQGAAWPKPAEPEGSEVAPRSVPVDEERVQPRTAQAPKSRGKSPRQV